MPEWITQLLVILPIISMGSFHFRTVFIPQVQSLFLFCQWNLKLSLQDGLEYTKKVFRNFDSFGSAGKLSECELGSIFEYPVIAKPLHLNFIEIRLSIRSQR